MHPSRGGGRQILHQVPKIYQKIFIYQMFNIIILKNALHYTKNPNRSLPHYLLTVKRQYQISLMNSFNKTEAAVFSCRLCFLRAFRFISSNMIIRIFANIVNGEPV